MSTNGSLSLGELLATRRDEIVARYLAELGTGSNELVARDLAAYLDEIGAALCEPEDCTFDEELPRWCVGDDLDDVTRQVDTLREVILAYAAEDAVCASAHELGVITRMLGGSIAAAAKRRAEAKERELILERRRFETLLHLLPAGLFVTDARGRLLETNAVAEQIWGGKLPKVQGPSEFGVYRARWPHGAPLAPDEWAVARALRTGETITNEEVEIHTFDGHMRTILNSAAALMDDRGDIVGAVALGVDITERKRFERALAFLVRAGEVLGSTLDYRATIQQVVQLVVPQFADWAIVDLLTEQGTTETPAVAHADPALVEELRRLRERHPPDAAANDGVYRVLRTGQALLVPEVPAEGAPDWNADLAARLAPFLRLGLRSYVIAPLIVSNRTVGTISLVHGSAGRRFDEADLALARGLALRMSNAIGGALLYKASQEALHAREDALATVSHDLRNPLNVIHVNTEFLLHLLDAGPLDTERGKRMLSGVLRAAQRMNRLVTDLLDLSKFEAGRAALELIPVQPSALLLGAHEVNDVAADAKGITLVDDVEPGPPVRCDRERMMQVLSNLVGNAIKFAPADSQVTLGVRTFGAEVRFFVRDEGPGIPPEQLPRLFEPYWQAPETAKAGSGLGLTIVKRIVEAHGGRVWCDSSLGAGSTFFFTLPRDDA